MGRRQGGRSSSDASRITLVEFAPSGGLFHFGLQLGDALARRGHSVRLVTGHDPELRSSQPGARTVDILPTWHPAAGRGVPEWWRKVRRVGRAARHVAAWGVLIADGVRTRPDALVWSEWRFPIDYAMVALTRAVLPHTTLGYLAHEPRPLVEQPGAAGLYKGGRLDAVLGRLAYRSLDVVYVLGDSAKRVVEEEWAPPAPVLVVPHGDEDVFLTRPVADVATTGPEVLFFGTVAGYKGLDVLFDAWPLVRARVPDARLRVAGKVNADVGIDTVRERAARLEGVDLHLGYVALEEVADHVERARLVALPYVRSSQSGVANLAHTFSRPVVATRVGDIPRVVVDHETGLLCEPRDPQGLADAIVTLLESPDLAARLGRQGRERLRAGATWDDVAALVDPALTRRSPRGGRGGQAQTPARSQDAGTDPRRSGADTADAGTTGRAARPLKVLQVLDSYAFGGAENLVAELARAQPDGLDIAVASITAPGDRDDMLPRMRAAGLRPLHLGVTRILDPVGTARFVRFLRRARPDVVHLHLETATIVGALACRIAGVPFVATLHHHPQDLSARWAAKERLAVDLASRLGTLVLVSQPAYDEFKRRYGPAGPHWRMIHNGVDVDRFRPHGEGSALDPGAAPLPEEPEDAVIWAAVAALRPPKGHLDLLRAWRTVVARHPEARLWIVGDGPARADIERAVAADGLEGSVRLLGARSDVPAVLARVHGVVSASHIEALPTALIEGAAAGVPVVATAAGGTSDTLVDGVTGRLVPVGDTSALAEALVAFTGDPAARDAAGAAGRAHAMDEFSMVTWITRLTDLYRKAIGRRTVR